MSEWNYDKSCLKIGEAFLGYVETGILEYIIILEKTLDGTYADVLCDKYSDDELIAWMPLPDAPEKKHRCQVINVVCESFLGGLLVSGKNIHGDFSFPVTFCPFCGERANE